MTPDMVRCFIAPEICPGPDPESHTSPFLRFLRDYPYPFFHIPFYHQKYIFVIWT